MHTVQVGGLTQGRPYKTKAMTYTEKFFINPDGEDEEMMVVDVLNPNVEKKIVRQMAEMLTMVDDNDTKSMDFATQERTRINEVRTVPSTTLLLASFSAMHFNNNHLFYSHLP